MFEILVIASTILCFYFVMRRGEKRLADVRDGSVHRELEFLRNEEARVNFIEVLEKLDLYELSHLSCQMYKHRVKTRRLLFNMEQRFHGNWL